MPLPHRLSLLLLRYSLIAMPGFSHGALGGAAEQDLANERFYTPPAAMEQHWQVDCSTLEHRISAVLQLSNAATASHKQELEALLGELGKCAMIYNPPGTAAQHSCPSYADSHAYLQQWLASDPAASHSPTPTPSSTAALQLIVQPLHCPLPH